MQCINLPLLALLLPVLLTRSQSQAEVHCDLSQPVNDHCPQGQVCGWNTILENRDWKGKCVAPPPGGVILPIPRGAETESILPVAYFPLSGPLVSSWPSTGTNDQQLFVAFEDDPVFGVVLKCQQDPILFDDVTYGKSGAFAINIWAKKNIFSSSRDDRDHYLFSHSSIAGALATDLDPEKRNQVYIYLPKGRLLDQGFIRTFVKGDKVDDGVATYLNSDGSYGDEARLPTGSSPTLHDGKWHMITLTSKPDGSKGFRLYMDGELAESSPESEDGSDPLKIQGRIFLCGRAGFASGTQFDGLLSKLSIYDDVLSPVQVRALYELTLGMTHKLLAPATEDSELDLEEQIIDAEEGTRVDSAAGLMLLGRDNKGSSFPAIFSGEVLLDEAEAIDLMELAKSVKLCDFEPHLTDSSCLPPQTCVPVHKRILEFLIEHSDDGDDETIFRNGVCSQNPEQILPLPLTDAALPIPLAFFPLTESSTESWPVGFSKGITINTTIVEDPIFGKVFHCDQNRQSLIVLDNIPYGAGGAFSINFWFRATGLEGHLFQYMFSHFGVEATFGGPDQASVYLAEDAHNRPSTVRSFLKDSNDNDKRGNIYIDSHGYVNDTTPPTDKKPSVIITDKRWHMATITTRSDRKKGFSMYLDSKLMGELVEDKSYRGVNGKKLPITGGDPFKPGGRIYLCGRFDQNPDRFFDGELAHLGLFSTALTEEKVASLYSFATKNMASLAIASEPVPIEDNSTEDDAASSPIISSWSGEISGRNGELYGPCKTNKSAKPECDKDLICVSSLKQSPEFGTEMEPDRVCVKSPGNGVYMLGLKNKLDPPMAYYPFTGAIIDSWPFPRFKAASGRDSLFVDDEVFGSVLDCRRARKDQVVLDHVEYGAKGSLTINLWTKKTKSHRDVDEAYEYLFSHTNPGKQKENDASQIQILRIGKPHPLFGLIRATIWDVNDVQDSLSYLDSDGTFANNNDRDLRPNLPNIKDGQWHMITLTTKQSMKPGYSLYIDGKLQATVKKPVKQDQLVTGGDPTGINGPIHICGRSNGVNNRHYEGHIAHLALWDKVLTAKQILRLYEESFVVAASKQVAHPARSTITGEPCVFPGILRGDILVDCGMLDGNLKCPTKDGTWIKCRDFEEEQSYNPYKNEVRYTVDNEPCKLPTKYKGAGVSDCLVIDGTQPKCRLSDKSKGWKLCADKVLRYSQNGSICELPTMIMGEFVTDCVGVDGVEKCRVNGDFCRCAPKDV